MDSMVLDYFRGLLHAVSRVQMFDPQLGGSQHVFNQEKITWIIFHGKDIQMTVGGYLHASFINKVNRFSMRIAA
jgi:hypothetical protein